MWYLHITWCVGCNLATAARAASEKAKGSQTSKVVLRGCFEAKNPPIYEVRA